VRIDRRDKGPIVSFAEAEVAKVFTQQEYHPEFGAVILVMLEGLSLPEWAGSNCLMTEV
jgi:hypothetical protein